MTVDWLSLKLKSCFIISLHSEDMNCFARFRIKILIPVVYKALYTTESWHFGSFKDEHQLSLVKVLWNSLSLDGDSSMYPYQYRSQIST